MRSRRPQQSVRLRLTLLYSGLFVVSAVGLLLLTNVLVRQATSGPFLVTTGDPGTGTRVALRAGDPVESEEVVQLLREQAEELRDAALAQRAADRRQLLLYSGVALGVMAVVSVGLGWAVAGRVLRPLATITQAAQEISAHNLSRRLALSGPRDELKDLGDTIDGLLDRLERSFEAQRQFVANASHELRTPLARQRTLIEVALSDPEASSESLRAAHERVLATGEEQERLIDALLVLARSEHGLAATEQLDLAAVAERALASAAPELAARALTLDASLEAAPFSGDRALVERLVANLLDNTLRYNRDRGEVRVATGNREGESFLLVANTGPEIRLNEVAGLVEPFRRLGQDRVRQREGHGLGLSIVRAIAEAHGARLSLRPLGDGGLSVEVVFPAAQSGD